MLHQVKLHAGACPSYFDDPFFGRHHASCWVGRLAQRLDLPACPDTASMSRLLRAEHMPGRHRAGGKQISGVQLTFSAPKTVSLAALVHGDERIVSAHLYAVLQCVETIQDRIACRVTRQCIPYYETSHGLLGAVFNRYQSRAHDPHLHSHVVIINSGMISSGEWRALDNRIFWDEGRLLGDLYQSTMSLGLRALGYEVVHGPTGLIEIAGISQILCKRMSSRMDQIRQRVEAVTSKSLDSISWLGTRSFAANTAPRRDYPSIELLRPVWIDAAGAELGDFTPPPTRSGTITWGASEEAAEALHRSMGELRCSNGGVKFAALLSHAYASSGGHLSMLDLLETMHDPTFIAWGIEGVPATVFDTGEAHAAYWARLDARRASKAFQASESSPRLCRIA